MSEFILGYVVEDKGRFFAGYYQNFFNNEMQFRVQGEGQSEQAAKNDALAKKALGLCFAISTENLSAVNQVDFDYKKMRDTDEIKRAIWKS